MKPASLAQTGSACLYRRRFFVPVLLILLLAAILQSIPAQQPAQLSLADILIALRSKKVTLVERNKILGDAVKTRGITFALTPEIEKELQSTGADYPLIEAIRQKSPQLKTVAAAQPKPVPTPLPTPPPPDFSFYRTRADGYIAKGDLDSAIADYNKAIELRSGEPSVYLNRGTAFLKKNNYDLSIVDFSKVIELNPKEPAAYLNRGNSYEKKGEIKKALDDYQKAVDLDGNNEAAKNSLQRLQAEQAKLEPPKPKDPEPTPAAAEPAKPTGPVNFGSLKNQAVKLLMPVYSSIDRQRNIQGMVTVQVTLDEEGKVIEAKATSGPATLRATSEDAARRSKFKPVVIAGQAVKATGFINYNFVGQGS
jgi:tetratricopeptide (TPR) repeat protein